MESSRIPLAPSLRCPKHSRRRWGDRPGRIPRDRLGSRSGPVPGIVRRTEMTTFEDSLRAVGYAPRIKQCLEVGNDSPLMVVLSAAGDEIRATRAALEIAERALKRIESSDPGPA